MHPTLTGGWVFVFSGIAQTPGTAGAGAAIARCSWNAAEEAAFYADVVMPVSGEFSG